jgi:ABC-type branched-subunit amino acid transport system permease subunit
VSEPRALRARTVRAAWLSLLAVALVVGPPFLGVYHQYLLALMLTNVIVATGLNLLTGNAGQISLCNSSFMAIGAYATIYLFTKADVSYWIALPLGGAVAALFGLLLGLPAVRVRGFYLAVVTLGFLEIMQIIIRQTPDLTGGVRGMLAPRPALFGFQLSADLHFYYVVLALAALGVYGAWSLLSSPTGRAFNAVRNSETVAQSLGVPVARTKLIAFVLSAFYAGIGGGLFAPLVGFIDPLEFGVFTSIQHVIFIVVGGLGTVAGSIVGAAVLTALPELLRGLKEYSEFFYSALLLAVLIGMPRGIVGLWPQVVVLPSRWLGRRGPAGAPRDGLP